MGKWLVKRSYDENLYNDTSISSVAANLFHLRVYLFFDDPRLTLTRNHPIDILSVETIPSSAPGKLQSNLSRGFLWRVRSVSWAFLSRKRSLLQSTATQSTKVTALQTNSCNEDSRHGKRWHKPCSILSMQKWQQRTTTTTAESWLYSSSPRYKPHRHNHHHRRRWSNSTTPGWQASFHGQCGINTCETSRCTTWSGKVASETSRKRPVSK
jgi:hypothetical protein